MNKLAVFFPGIGYTVDKPLMHYSRRIAAGYGYEMKLLPYTGFPRKVKGDRQRMEESCRIAKKQTEELLSDTDISAYDKILFIGKSIGTIVAAELSEKSPASDRIRLLFYTPLKDTFSFSFGDALVFTGTADPWVGENEIPGLCRRKNIPCITIPGGNHSLETGSVPDDILNMQLIMKETDRFINLQSSPVRCTVR